MNKAYKPKNQIFTLKISLGITKKLRSPNQIYFKKRRISKADCNKSEEIKALGSCRDAKKQYLRTTHKRSQIMISLHADKCIYSRTIGSSALSFCALWNKRAENKKNKLPAWKCNCRAL